MDKAFSREVLGCSLDRWAQFWGDPMLQGTASMFLYAAGGTVLLLVARRTDRPDRRLWLVCAAIFFLQVVNTHLDLHAFPKAYGHCLAFAQGWYEARGPVKMLGAMVIGGAIVAALLVALVAWRRSLRANVLLVAGVGIALGCTLIKGAGVNVVEEVYHRAISRFRWVEVIEYGGVALAAFAGLIRLGLLRRARKAEQRERPGDHDRRAGHLPY